jgi:trk system potassium uptake protein TrkH
MDGEVVSQETVRSTYVFFGLYSLIALFSILFVSTDGFSLETSVSAVMACLNNIGPGLAVVGPMGNYAQLSDASKGVLSLNMLIGRLEIFPILVMCFPGRMEAGTPFGAPRKQRPIALMGGTAMPRILWSQPGFDKFQIQAL